MGNTEQIEYWNGEGGRRWAARDDAMDRLLRPIATALLRHLAPAGCRRAIDVGCGGGSQTLMLARELGPAAQVLGVDVSQPLLDVARARFAAPDPGAAAADFLQADAAVHDFAPGQFDLLFSRFGVMFFDEPAAAFRNLRRGLCDGARLGFSCWQSLQDNTWARLPLQAAMQHVASPDKSDPYAPGPFAFADPGRVRGILENAGFAQVEIVPHPVNMQFGDAPTLAQAVRELVNIGPVSRLVAGVEPGILDKVQVSIERVVAQFYRDGSLQLPGATWFVTAVAV